jgi:hypothetical protein
MALPWAFFSRRFSNLNHRFPIPPIIFLIPDNLSQAHFPHPLRSTTLPPANYFPTNSADFPKTYQNLYPPDLYIEPEYFSSLYCSPVQLIHCSSPEGSRVHRSLIFVSDHSKRPARRFSRKSGQKRTFPDIAPDSPTSTPQKSGKFCNPVRHGVRANSNYLRLRFGSGHGILIADGADAAPTADFWPQALQEAHAPAASPR